MINLGLQRISHLLAETPLPWNAIHVAGTNGKGSICTYIDAMLCVYNRSQWRSNSCRPTLRTGRFTSPHLIDRWDCISIDSKPATGPAFKAVEQKVLERNSKEGIGASEFEILTATAFEYFTQQKVDVGIVEVGMGGRLDATNVLGQREEVDPLESSSMPAFRPMPLVTLISSIGLDHQAFLGHTLADIAREKAGIIKPGVPVVYDDSNPAEVIDIIRSVASSNSSPLVEGPGSGLNLLLEEWTCTTMPELISRVANVLRRSHGSGSGEIPPHVVRNASLAFLGTLLALRQLTGVDFKVPMLPEQLYQKESTLRSVADDMLKAASKVTFPGRQQRISIENLTGRKELILLDGAHNAQSAQTLRSTVNNLRLESSRDGEQGNVTWVLAASDSKDAKEIFAPLLKDGDAVFAVEFGPVDGMPWVKPLSASKVVEAAKEVVSNVESVGIQDCEGDLLRVLSKTSAKADGGPLVVAGSLYLVGDVLRLLRDG